jgi:hypothetical protein
MSIKATFYYYNMKITVLNLNKEVGINKENIMHYKFSKRRNLFCSQT